MAAAVSIAPVEANTADPRSTGASRNKSDAEAPVSPANKKDDGLLYRAVDLGLLIPTLPSTGSIDVDAMSTASPGIQEKPEISSEAEITGRVPTRARNAVVRLPPPSPLPYTFVVRQQWEGVVTRVGNDEFSVVLRDLTPAATPELEAVLPIEEVSDEDLPLLREGAVLYWSIGYEHTLTGQRKRVSVIRFRRLPSWTRKELNRIKQAAAELNELFHG